MKLSTWGVITLYLIISQRSINIIPINQFLGYIFSHFLEIVTLVTEEVIFLYLTPQFF